MTSPCCGSSAAWTSAKHLRNAAAGTRRGRRVPATLRLRRQDDDETARHGIVTLHADPRGWDMAFATSPDWTPEAAPPTVEDYKTAVRAHLDAAAQSRLYTDGNSLATYTASTNPPAITPTI